jgi:hypothetical protein
LTVDEHARFCLQCGTPLMGRAVSAEADDVTDPGASSPPQQSVVDRGDDPTDLSMPVHDATQVVDVELVSCPNCGSSNAARRARCGRCGQRLRPDAPPLPATDMDDDDAPAQAWAPSEPPPVPSRRRGIGIAIVVLGILIGAGVGLAAGLGLGPFAAPEVAEFDPRAYPSAPEQVRPTAVGASTTAPMAGDITIGPQATVDEDLGTAWLPRDDDDRPLLVHRFTDPVWVSRIEVATGWQVDDATFFDNGRVTGARIDLGTLRVDATIADVRGWQVIRLPRPVLLEEITWQVTETIGGTGALAEVRYVGWPADDADTDRFRDR